MKSKVVVFGSTGLVGSRFIELNKEKYNFLAPTIEKLDILNLVQLTEFIEKSDASVIINFAAYTDVDKAEEESGNTEGIVYKINALAPKYLADICKNLNKYLIHISTDYIFPGTKSDGPYSEEDTPGAVNWYGQTKFLGEKNITESGVKYAIVRIEMPYSSHFDLKKDIARTFLEMLEQGKEINALTDQKVTPVFVDDIANALSLVIEKQPEGILHVVSADTTTPFEFAQTIAEVFGLDKSLVTPNKLAEYNLQKTVKRPQYSWLSAKKFENIFGTGILHTTKESLKFFKAQIDSLK